MIQGDDDDDVDCREIGLTSSDQLLKWWEDTWELFVISVEIH